MLPWLLIQLTTGAALDIPNVTRARGILVTPASLASDVRVGDVSNVRNVRIRPVSGADDPKVS